MMPFTTKNHKLRTILPRVAAVLFWLLVWQLAYLHVAQELLLVSPMQAAQRLFSLFAERAFWQSVGMTVLRVAAGFLAAVAAGLPLAALTARFQALHILFQPVLNVVRSTPVASFIILALVWMRRDRVPVFIVLLMVLPMVWANVHTGIRETPRSLLEMASVFRLGARKTLAAVYLPAVMPYFMVACSNGLGFAWKAAIAAEVISLPRIAMGREIYNAKIYFETVDLFAWTIAVIGISILLERLTMYGLRALQNHLKGR